MTHERQVRECTGSLDGQQRDEGRTECAPCEAALPDPTARFVNARRLGDGGGLAVPIPLAAEPLMPDVIIVIHKSWLKQTLFSE